MTIAAGKHGGFTEEETVKIYAAISNFLARNTHGHLGHDDQTKSIPAVLLRRDWLRAGHPTLVGAASRCHVDQRRDLRARRRRGTPGGYCLSRGRGPLPAILSVHGGRWRAGNRTDASSIKVDEWAAAGYFAMSIDYRLVGSTPAPAAYQDLFSAIRWLHAHSTEYHVDENRIYLIGQSAGGHMVSLAATLGDGYPKTGGWNDARSDFRAAISVAGAYNLNTLDWGNLWTPMNQDAREARTLASPTAHISASTRPILIMHSGR